MKRCVSSIRLLVMLISFLSFDQALSAQMIADISRLKTLTLEQLLRVEVVSAGRKPQLYSQAASAIGVLTSERIRRSGARTIADALRIAPGLHVVRSDGRTWGISARGLNLNTANKLQVLMDGRILYTPLFGGVFWDAQDYLLADIDRIEVVRGPGATLWGGNAVNGVINIMTLSAQDTQGGIAEIGAGTEEHAFIGARYGSKFGDATYYRGYFKFFDRDSLVQATGEDAGDDWQAGRGGFRIDTDLTQTSTLTVQGDAYRNDLHFLDRDSGTLSGGNVLLKWNRFFKGNSDLGLIVYYDRNDRRIPEQFQEKRNTVAVDLQHRFQPFERHDVVWGVNYFASADETETLGSSAWAPEDRTVHHFSGFVQNDFSLIPEKVLLILGTKIEDNTFSHLEVQPNVRVAWTPTMQHTLWGAVGRAVRVPSRLDTDFRFSPTPGVLAIRGNPDFKPEEVIGAEIGYRMTPRTNLFFDITVFHHSYDSLITVEPGPPGQPSILGNGMNADITGATLIVNFEPLSWVRASSSFTLMDKTLELDPDSRDMSNAAGEGNDPDHYWTLHVMADPIQNFKFDVILRSSGELPSPAVPGYVTMDLRAGWSVTDQLELAIVGQNLFQPSMPEFGAPLPTRREIQRSVYGQATWFF